MKDYNIKIKRHLNRACVFDMLDNKFYYKLNDKDKNDIAGSIKMGDVSDTDILNNAQIVVDKIVTKLNNTENITDKLKKVWLEIIVAHFLTYSMVTVDLIPKRTRKKKGVNE